MSIKTCKRKKCQLPKAKLFRIASDPVAEALTAGKVWNNIPQVQRVTANQDDYSTIILKVGRNKALQTKLWMTMGQASRFKSF